MSATLYLESGARGAHSKELQVRCREGFRKLLERCGYTGQMPRLIACGSRNEAVSDFKKATAQQSMEDFVALWIDSEDPLADLEATWAHLKQRDNWLTPAGATDEQVFFMTTCMETLISADRDALKDHYGAELQISALPPLVNLETRDRHDIQTKLIHATRNCKNPYAKGSASFEILAKLSASVLSERLPSFARTRRILDGQLSGGG